MKNILAIIVVFICFWGNAFAITDNECGLTQSEIDLGVTCGGNNTGITSIQSTSNIPIDEESFIFYQEAKIAVSGIILATLLVFHFFKYVRE